MQVEDRLKFAAGIIITLLFHFLISLIFHTLIDVNLSGQTYTIVSGLIDVIAISISLCVGLIFYKKFTQKSFIPLNNNLNQDKERDIVQINNKDDSSVAILNDVVSNFTTAFKLDNLGNQLIWALLILCLIYLPLDLLSYTIPGIYQFQADTLLVHETSAYFLFDPISKMILTGFIYHFFIALREELYFRNYIHTIGKDCFKPGTNLIYGGILFGLAHFSYIFSPHSQNYSAFYPILWGLNALIIGLVSGYYFIEKNRIIPVLIAHWINNGISSISMRFYLDGHPLSYAFYRIYLPFFILGIIMCYFYRKPAVIHIKSFFGRCKDYLYECQQQYDIENLPSPFEINKKLKGETEENRPKEKKSKVQKWKESIDSSSKSEGAPPKNISKKNKTNKPSKDKNKVQKKKIDLKKIYKYVLVDIIILIIIWLLQTFLLINVPI